MPVASGQWALCTQDRSPAPATVAPFDVVRVCIWMPVTETSSVRSPALVTGATGFIGRRLIARLRSDSVSVVALLLPDEPVPEEWADAGGALRVVRGNVSDRDSVAAAIEGVGTVFHLAALVAEQNSDYDAHWNVTAEGSKNVYEAAAHGGARVIVTTSICAYGDRVARDVCREDSERGQHQGPYGRAKQGQEDYALEAHARGLAVTIVRPSNVYGVGSKPWVELLAERLAAGEMATIDDGVGNAGLVHVDNLVDALVALGASDATIGRIYNVCDGLPVTWRKYMDDLAAALGVAPPPSLPRDALYAMAADNESPKDLIGPKAEEIPPLELLNLVGSDSRFPTDRIREDVGWEPRVGYDEALAGIRAHLLRRSHGSAAG